MPCGTTPTQSGEVGRGYGLGPGRTSGAIRLHEGMDFVAARGDKVRAAWGGVVDLVGRDEVLHGPLDGYGNAVVVRTVVSGMGTVWWLYAHLESAAVVVGQPVLVGQYLGRIGNTTNGKFPGMGPHLHHVTATRPWPKGYGAGSFDPVLAYEAIGMAFEPRTHRHRARVVKGPDCPWSPLGSAIRSQYALGALGIDPTPGEEYEPPPEAFTEEYEVSDLGRIGPLLFGFGAAAVLVGLVGSAIAGATKER